MKTIKVLTTKKLYVPDIGYNSKVAISSCTTAFGDTEECEAVCDCEECIWSSNNRKALVNLIKQHTE